VLFGVSLLKLLVLNDGVKCDLCLGSPGGLDSIYGQAIWFTSVSLCLFHTKPFTRSGFLFLESGLKKHESCKQHNADVSESCLPVGKDYSFVCVLVLCF
jgi:hypothetical protein